MAMKEDDATTPNYEGKEEEVAPEVSFSKHIKYFKRVLAVLPCSASSLDSNRMTLVFFAVSGLDLLGALDTLTAKERKEVSEWIYGQQILPGENGDTSYCGFRGSSFIGAPFEGTTGSCNRYDTGHIAMGYTAIATLLILGDNLSRVNREAVLDGIRRLQLPNGSFSSTADGSENDMRFVYCAASLCHIFGDWTAMDVEKTTEFIKSSQGYDGGIGQGPFLESHGGSTFCGVAALSLMGKLEGAFSPTQQKRLMEWCLFRQQTGFQGRPNKPVDTCYSFWIGATLEILGGSCFVDREWNRRYVLSTENTVCGGLSKWPNHQPDPLHTYLGLCGLSLNGERKLRPVHAALNISQRAAQHLITLNTLP